MCWGLNRANGLEIYISQGAKPGLRGQLMAKKVTPELARIRGIPRGIDLRSPSRHPDILGGDDLLTRADLVFPYYLPICVIGGVAVWSRSEPKGVLESELVEEVRLGGRRANPGAGEGRWVRSSGGRWGGGGFAAGEVAASGLVAEGHACALGQRVRHGKFGEGVRKEKVRVPQSGSYSCVPWTAPISSPTFAPLTSNRAIGSALARMPGASPGSSWGKVRDGWSGSGPPSMPGGRSPIVRTSTWSWKGSMQGSSMPYRHARRR